ncbi:2-oxoglutarate dehydrogenase complex dihydrolipoyllysine-residue succinyltransferase [Acidihalobacter prosperus]
MSIEVKIPPLPESVADATLAAWHKQPGENVDTDDNLADLETDKVVLELPAPGSGVLDEILVPAGATVKTGQVIARLKSSRPPIDPSPKTTAEAEIHANKHAKAVEKDIPAGPAARQIMIEHDIRPEQIQGSGRHGRILKEDVLAYLAANQSTPPPEKATDSRTPSPVDSEIDETMANVSYSGQRREQRVPMTRLRARIAERLLTAQRNTAMLTTFNEVDMKPVMDIRQRYREAFEKKHQVRLGFMSFFVSSTIAALQHFPTINASIDGDDIVYHGFYDIGIAVSSSRGLVVPIIRDADQLTAAEIERKIADFANRAHNNALELDEITGGTFTITNGGVFGSLLSTPILNPPQSAILGMHKIQDRAVVINGEIAIRPMMYLALSYDHRIVDGHEAVQFLAAIKSTLEDPARLLLGL